MVRGLLIEIKSWETGERAYGIDPRDPNLRALGGPLWQCLDHEPKGDWLDHEPKGDWEIRLVLDNRDLSGYEGKIILDDGSEVYHVADIPADATIVDVDGVIVLNSDAEINAVLDHLPDKIYGRMEEVRAWAEKQGITPRSVEEEIREKVKSVAKKGHEITANKRKKPIEQIVFGHPMYAFIKKVHDSGCPHTWKATIPKV